jgi:predicted amidohydrolase
MKLVLVQHHPAYLDVSGNLDRMGETLSDLFDGEGADLVVLPELFASGYYFKSAADCARVAEPVPGGPTTDFLMRWARETGATFVAGLPERDGERRYNSAAVVGPEGVVGCYRKVHLFYREKDVFTPGDRGFPVFDVADRAGNDYRLGVMVCFDWYFPESARSLALSGADVIAHPSNLVRKDCPRAMPIRALENHVFTATANRIGEETAHGETLRFVGQSRICSPEGDVLAEAGRDEETVLVASVDPVHARDRQLTTTNDLFGDRRPPAYRLL